ncbi:MAG TPA: hypothetical protein PLN05_11415 [Pyrinomonadaceae bacterium]|nr:hypothetical protein [Chloracidobacterium sp.]HBE81830.1 hypothetical protein [Blastocatellia bacterium]HRJ89832.1 hypothetical protein [Pyrinomonadaceae bacterium]HRK51029.1 hypothetical protein [Pyrinomonadaceae bacterium]
MIIEQTPPFNKRRERNFGGQHGAIRHPAAISGRRGRNAQRQPERDGLDAELGGNRKIKAG